MPSPYDLTTLAACKAWLFTEPTDSSNAQIQGLITAASRMIYSALARPSLLPRSFSERYDGQGRREFFLKNYPVLSISALSNYGIAIPQGSPPSPAQPIPTGFIFQPWDGIPPGQPQRVDVYGNYPYGSYGFNYGRENVAVTYMAGYAIQGEAWDVPTATPWQVTPIQPYGPWGSDLGVTYANGTALVVVSGPPTVGQYSVSAGVYTFAEADANAPVLISYGFIPADINQLATELVGERFSYQSRIGTVSKSLGGQETVSFSQKSMSDAQRAMLQPFVQVFVPA